MTFDQLFADHHLTDGERTELIYHLAAIRARKTIEALLKSGSACQNTAQAE